MFTILRNVIDGATESAQGPPGLNSVSGGAAIIINVLIGVTFSMSIIGIAYAFIEYIMSQGDPKRIAKAWNSLLWSVIAAMVTVAAIAIKNVLIHTFNVQSGDIQNGPDF